MKAEGRESRGEGRESMVGLRSTRPALTIGSVGFNPQFEIDNLKSRIGRLERFIWSHLGGQPGLDREARRAATITSELLNVTVAAILGRCKQAHIVTARHLTWYLLVEHSAATCNHLATMWQVHHGAVSYGVNSIQARMLVERKLAEHVLAAVDAFIGRPSSLVPRPSFPNPA